MEFKDRLFELRQKSGLSQKKLADILGVSQASVGYWEKGQRIPSVKAAQKIADYFQVPVTYLLCEDFKLPPDIPPVGMIRIGEGENAMVVEPMDFIEHFNNVAKKAHPSDLSDLLEDFFTLNAKGQKEAAHQTNLLTKIPEYRKDTEE